MEQPPLSDPIQQLQGDFRQQLELFYAQLQLAPPYHTVEAAVARLVASLRTLSPEERRGLLDDPMSRWQRYREAFQAGGLHRKHRGPLLGAVRSGRARGLPAEHQHFLRVIEQETRVSGAQGSSGEG